MRSLSILALSVLTFGCSSSDGEGSGQKTASGVSASGPDIIALRLPRGGGITRGFLYPALDSAVWRALEPVPSVDRVLAFDQENGMLAYVDHRGTPGWIDLRLGTSRPASRARLTGVSSADGWAIYGVLPPNTVQRLTPSGDWSFKPGDNVRRLFPLPDGALVLLTQEGERGAVMASRIRPPDSTVVDSASAELPQRAVVSPVGDRLFFSVGRSLLGLSSRDLSTAERVSVREEILAIAPTPSGDRVYVATKGGRRVEVVNRYSRAVEGSVELPGFVTDLRMDPLGRYLLARPVPADSAWVIDIGTNRLVASLPTAWRTDLPAVVPDGSIAVARNADVFFIDPLTRNTVRTAAGGSGDLWHFLLWNGFRPRARELDEPVQFEFVDTLASQRTQVDTVSIRPPVAVDTSPPPAARVTPVDTAPRAAPTRDSWTVSFAALLSEQRARELASSIRVDGQTARVVAGNTGGTMVYRVVLGPYPSKAEAERIGRASRHSYWVYEGVP